MRSARFRFRSYRRRPRLNRQTAALLAASGIALIGGCSVDGVLTPPADIGTVGSIAPVRGRLSRAAVDYPVPVVDPTGPIVPAAEQPSRMSLPSDAAASSTPSQTGPGEAGGPSRTVSVMDSDRVIEGRTADPTVAGVGTATPRLVPGAGNGSRQPADESRLAGEERAPHGGKEVQVAFDVHPVDPTVIGGASARTDAPPSGRGVMPAAEVACRQQLRQLGVRYVDIPAISDGPSCGIAYPIRVTGLSGGIRITPAATLNCQVTVEFAKWVAHDVAPAARTRYFSGVKSIKQLSSYSCRTMNSQRGAPMSEHAHGNAIDIGRITLNSGREIDVRQPGFFAFRQRGFLNTIRADSCGYFDTVLGPGTNKYHWNHFHFDLRQRKSGRTYCE